MHTRLTDEARENAALFALGALDDEETRRMEEHLQSGCSVCAREVQAMQAVARGLLFAAAPAPPPEDLRAQLLARVAQEPQADEPSSEMQIWKRWDAAAGANPSSYLQRSNDGVWEETSVPGVSVRRLFLDPHRRQVTMLIRMRAGTRWPSHRHGGVEECYVLAGDLKVGDVVMRAGDYQRVEEGSVHPVQETEAGCLLFILSSMQDEILA